MKHHLQLKLGQHLTLTPQLQQSIRLLQLSTLELNQEIEQIQQDNPLLEREGEEEGGSTAESSGPNSLAEIPPAQSEAESAKAERDEMQAMPDEMDWNDAALSPKKRALLEIVAAAGALPVSDLAERMPNAGIHLRGLERSGHVEVCARRLYRDPFGEAIHPDAPPELTVDQRTAVGAVSVALGQGFRAFLLKGVTGSGKTEVYMRVASQAMASGTSVVVLVPEIALITQTERRFRARFGDDVAVLHSALSEGERFDQWTRILRREVRIAIGARSACSPRSATWGR